MFSKLSNVPGEGRQNPPVEDHWPSLLYSTNVEILNFFPFFSLSEKNSADKMDPGWKTVALSFYVVPQSLSPHNQ